MKEEIKLNPLVEILIVSYNGKKHILQCLASLQELNYYKNRYIITIIDNNSHDETVSCVKILYPEVRIIRNNANLGFGRANNQGIVASNPKTKYIALLNQDSLVDKNWLKELVDTMEKNPDAGACGAAEKEYALYKKGTHGEKRIKDCLWMGGGSVIFRKKALYQGGYFDPFYFMYVEDMDLTWRLKIAGWKILHNFNALWYHAGKDRKLTYNDKRLYWAWKNRLYLILKFGSWQQIWRSFSLYLSMLIHKKETEQSFPPADKEKHRKQEQSIISHRREKVLFLSKLILSFSVIMVCALWARRKLRNKFSINTAEVDAWIRYTDAIFCGRSKD